VRQKPLELLKALITFGGHDVPAIRLMETLWPEAEGDRASQSLKFTIHALRKLLGGDEFIQLKGGKLGINTDYCMVDIWQIQSLLKRIDSLADPDPSFSRNCNRVIDLYRGDFLPGDIDLGWTTPLREGLRCRVMGIAARLADYHTSSGDHGQAIKIATRALEIDHLREDFYQRLMRSHLHLGRYADAVLVYRRCRDTLRAELGVSRSDETESLYRQATRR